MATTPRLLRKALALLGGGLLAGCSLVSPPPAATSIEDRLRAMPTTGLPLTRPVTIYWNEHQIPFIVAEADEDAAFALGVVHAHLRLGQMAVYRRIAQGRIAEMAGPLATDIDHGVRVLDFPRAASAMLAKTPPETRRWLDRFVAGVNTYQERLETLPIEFDVLGLEREPWTAEDLLAFGRLAGSDVNWLVWFNLLKLRERQDWRQIWARIVDAGGEAAPEAATANEAALSEVLRAVGRSGSNSLAIAPSRTTTGGAILANDPHLGLNVPNTWLVAGVKSPSYHAVGLMIPGLPVFAIGRNADIAWGGTNMRASSSDLVDVSALDAGERRQRRERIKVRWWFDRDVVLNDTSRGPIVGDAPQMAGLGLENVALRWTGHEPTDEITAMLEVARSRSFEEFRAAFATFSVPGQNMLYADRAGNIGSVYAVQLPDRGTARPSDVVVGLEESDHNWRSRMTVGSLPGSLNPPEGFLASANNRPNDGAAVGYFFSPDDRVERMRSLVMEAGALGVEQVKSFQRDVYVASSMRLRDALVQRMRETGVAERASGRERRLIDAMTAWDGHYHVESSGAVAFEMLQHAVVEDFYQATFGATDLAAFAGVGRIKALLQNDIEAAPAAQLTPLLEGSLKRAAETIDDYANWGEMHRLVLQHPLALLPMVGQRYRFADYPIGGATDSLMKTAHGSTNERHRARYGANARHVSDLSDADANYFVLLGGQDGWLNSSTFLDQVPLWLRGDYVRVPLRVDAVAASFSRVSTLSP